MRSLNKWILNSAMVVAAIALIPELWLIYEWLFDNIGLLRELSSYLGMGYDTLSIGGALFIVLGVMSMIFVKIDDEMPEPGSPVPFIGFSGQLSPVLKSCLKLLLRMLLAFFLVFPLLLAVGMALALATMMLFIWAATAIYYVTMRRHRDSDERQYRENTSRFVCPECGKVFERPDYRLESTVVPGLKPSIFGIKRIETETKTFDCYGSASGRKLIEQSCPGCRATVGTKEGKPWVLTIAGGPGSGKTSFAFSAIGGMMGSMGNDNASSASLYRSEDVSALSMYRSGRCQPTAQSLRASHILCFESSRFVTQRMAYLCDIGGGYFLSGGSESDLQPQYAYNDAIAFVVDPCAEDPARKASEAYYGFMERYRRLNRMDASRTIRTPIAVVVTHADRQGAFHGVPDEGVREAMVGSGFFNLVNLIEKDFSSVSFFACDATKEGGASAAVRHLCRITGSGMEDFFRGPSR